MARKNPSARRALTEIHALEKRLTQALDQLPDIFLGIDPAMTQALCNAVRLLANPVELVELMAKIESERFDRSGVGQTRSQAEQRRAVREYIAHVTA